MSLQNAGGQQCVYTQNNLHSLHERWKFYPDTVLLDTLRQAWLYIITISWSYIVWNKNKIQNQELQNLKIFFAYMFSVNYLILFCVYFLIFNSYLFYISFYRLGVWAQFSYKYVVAITRCRMKFSRFLTVDNYLT